MGLARTASSARVGRVRSAFGLTLFLLALVAASASTAGDAPTPNELWDPARTDLVADCYGVWRWGADYFGSATESPRPSGFHRISPSVRDYLNRRWHARSEASGVVGGDVGAHELETALLSGEPDRQLSALVVLMKSRTSASVGAQLRVARTLLADSTRLPVAELLRLLLAEFDQPRLVGLLESAAATGWPAEDGVLWALHAVGVAGHATASRLLLGATTAESTSVQVAAVDGLSALGGSEAALSLRRVSLGGQRIAAGRAISYLARGAPEILRGMLSMQDLGSETRDLVLLALVQIDDLVARRVLIHTLTVIGEEALPMAVHSLQRVPLSSEETLVVQAAISGTPEGERRRMLEALIGYGVR